MSVQLSSVKLRRSVRVFNQRVQYTAIVTDGRN